MITGMQREALPELPPGKTVIDVFGDFLKYLFSCARRFITQTHANGESLWGSVDSRIDFIFGHPNGWEGLQQSKMRQAAVAAELIPDTPAGHARVHFVTEGEASLHYCLDGGLASDVIKVRTLFPCPSCLSLSAHRYMQGWIQSRDYRCRRRDCRSQLLFIRHNLPNYGRRDSNPRLSFSIPLDYGPLTDLERFRYLAGIDKSQCQSERIFQG